MQFRTVAHTPEQTGGFSDEELVNIFTMGMVPRRSAKRWFPPLVGRTCRREFGSSRTSPID